MKRFTLKPTINCFKNIDLRHPTCRPDVLKTYLIAISNTIGNTIRKYLWLRVVLICVCNDFPFYFIFLYVSFLLLLRAVHLCASHKNNPTLIDTTHLTGLDDVCSKENLRIGPLTMRIVEIFSLKNRNGRG